MSTTRPTLAAEHREVTGKAVSRLRKAGRLPAVVYGHGEGSANVTVDAHEFDLLRKHTGPNTLVDLTIDGQKAKPVLINGVQVHPVNRRALHLDLFLVKMTEELTVDVPLVPVGESVAIAQLGGTLLHVTETVKVRALPDHLPQSIEYSIESLVDFDAAIHVRDLNLNRDLVQVMTDGDTLVATVVPPRIEEEEPEPVLTEEELEAAAAAEGEEGEGAEGGEEPSEGGESGSEGSSETE